MIQLALLAKEFRLVPDETGSTASTVAVSRAARSKSTTRPKRPNRGAAEFAAYWANGLNPKVEIDKNGRTWIQFRRADADGNVSVTIDSDIEHVRRALKTGLKRYTPGDMAAGPPPRSIGTLTLCRLEYPELSLRTIFMIEDVHRALALFLLPHNLEFEEWRSRVLLQFIKARWQPLGDQLFEALDGTPELVERVRLIGQLTPLTRKRPQRSS